MATPYEDIRNKLQAAMIVSQDHFKRLRNVSDTEGMNYQIREAENAIGKAWTELRQAINAPWSPITADNRTHNLHTLWAGEHLLDIKKALKHVLPRSQWERQAAYATLRTERNKLIEQHAHYREAAWRLAMDQSPFYDPDTGQAIGWYDPRVETGEQAHKRIKGEYDDPFAWMIANCQNNFDTPWSPFGAFRPLPEPQPIPRDPTGVTEVRPGQPQVSGGPSFLRSGRPGDGMGALAHAIVTGRVPADVGAAHPSSGIRAPGGETGFPGHPGAAKIPVDDPSDPYAVDRSRPNLV